MLSRGLAGVLVLTLLSGCSSSREPVERIVFITIDTLRWDHVGYVGYDVATPNLDRPASSGTAFTQAVTSAPITLPALCSMRGSGWRSKSAPSTFTQRCWSWQA